LPAGQPAPEANLKSGVRSRDKSSLRRRSTHFKRKAYFSPEFFGLRHRFLALPGSSTLVWCSPGDATYTFKHALVRDAAYAGLLKTRRRE